MNNCKGAKKKKKNSKRHILFYFYFGKTNIGENPMPMKIPTVFFLINFTLIN